MHFMSVVLVQQFCFTCAARNGLCALALRQIDELCSILIEIQTKQINTAHSQNGSIQNVKISEQINSKKRMQFIFAAAADKFNCRLDASILINGIYEDSKIVIQDTFEPSIENISPRDLII